ncbi:MAG: hypothetical protein HC830_07145 [Bacteroidetes bacterium]|nr:hypothetical protein [Bacteroidota bacterium]
MEKFHSVINVGIQPGNLGSPLWMYGVGGGTSQGISPKSLLDFDVTFNHVVKNGIVGNNFLYKAYLGIDRTLSSHISLAFGVSYNFLVTDLHDNDHTDYYDDIAPYTFSSQSYNRYNLKTWAGFKVGLRFR